ncbi:hypothetical protein SAMN05443144_12214 [Fodinibius roseus]|uniref:Uncharacterized protein n=1 Tax=Fodinibius roseus TaxID=1194090 RepID=A0A1M5I3Q6_9BACT|nr:hypothetical protein SAMN05443144_12214 [Fodinibius roseus]
MEEGACRHTMWGTPQLSIVKWGEPWIALFYKHENLILTTKPKNNLTGENEQAEEQRTNDQSIYNYGGYGITCDAGLQWRTIG